MGVSPPQLSVPSIVPGFRIGVASCGVKSAALRGKRQDLMLLVSDVDCHAAGLFTRNRFRAACVDMGEATLAANAEHIRAVVANAGNANAGVGDLERTWAREMIEAAADATAVDASKILSASTGVIGTPFPIERIRSGMREAAQNLAIDHWQDGANAIRTTDTFAKWASRSCGPYSITGIAKGSGMIHPDMATMLCFIATDAPLDCGRLQVLLKRAADRSFNAISVDGDTSTNDTVYLLANGLAHDRPRIEDTAEFESALTDVCVELAQLIVRDGEGVSKFVTIEVAGAASETEARQVGRAIAVSLLVKTAFAGSDANWGRILAAIGNSGVNVEPRNVSLRADDVEIVTKGNLHASYRDEDGMAVFARSEFRLRVDLGMGAARATVWTGDLTHDYIRINAEYRT